MLEVRLLGPPEITLDGTPVEVDTRKAIALLAYLVVEKSATRDTLSALFWADSPGQRARATLRRTLSALRGGTGADLLDADRSVISLVGEISCDIDILDDELAATGDHDHDQGDVCPRCIPHLQRAAAMHRGEFLEGFSVKASPEFDDWVRSVTESLRLRVGTTFNRLGTALAANGEYPAAIAVVSQWIDLDQLHEPAHRFLMLLHAWAGDRPGAIEAYRKCVAILDHELGVSPLHETTELYEAILDEDLPPAPGARRRIRAAAPPRSRLDTELIDRDEELQALRDGLAAASARGRLISITGSAWMGKTRLLEEIAAEAHGLGRVVLIGRAFPMEQQLPYGVLTQVLRAALPHIESAPEAVPDWARVEIGRLLPASQTAEQAGLPDRFGELRLFEGIHTTLTTLATERPVVLILDDAHWADAASASAFSYLSRRISGSPVLMIVSARSGIGLHPAIAELIGGADHSIALGPLTVKELMNPMGDETRARQILQQTGGVPLLVREAIRSAEEGMEEVPGILLYLESRLREVTELSRQILTAAAVLDGICDASLLRSTSGRSEDEVVEAVEELISVGLLREVPGSDALGFTLDTLEGVVYDSISLVRRRLLHRRAARALADRGHAATDPRLAGAIAAQYRAAGDPEAAGWYRIAGDLAKAIYAHDSARDFYEACLALGSPDVAAVRLALGELAMAAGDYERARHELTVAASNATPASIGAIEHRLGEVERLLGRFKVAEEHFERALSDEERAAEVLADWALLAHRTGDAGKAIELADKARRAAEEQGDAAQMSRVRNILGVVTPNAGTALAHVGEALRLAGEADLLRMAALNNQALLLAEMGDGEEASRLVLEAIAIAEKTGHRHREAALWNHLADLHHQAGRETEARDSLTRSVSLFAEIDAGVLEPELWLLTRW